MEWLLLNIILCLSLLLLLWVRRRRKRFSIFKDQRIPGPEPNFWIGNFNDFIQKRDGCLPEYFEKYGRIFGCFLGAKPFLVVADPDLIRIIQIKAFKSFSNRDGLLPDAGIPHPGISLIMSLRKDEDWKILRSIVSPSFSSSKLKKVVPIINDAISLFLKNISEKAKNNEVFDIALMYRNLTMDTSTRTKLGIKTGIQNGENNLFLESAALTLNTDTTNILAGISICFPELEPIPTMLRLLMDRINYILGRKSINALITLTKDIIRQRRNSNERREDILQSLIDAKIDATKLPSIEDYDLITTSDYQQKEQTQEVNDSEEFVSLSDESISLNALLFLVAGFDTTSGTIAFVTYYLAKYQDIQEKLRQEINSNIKEGASIQYEDIFNLHYLDQVISETLRLHSLSMLATTRVAKENFRYNGLTIPMGITVGIPSYLLHRHPDHWPEPEKFNPERFSPENKSKIDPTMYQPFGNGPRNCIGMRFAQIMMKLTLVRLLRSYKLEKANEGELDIKFSLFLSRPKELLVKVIPI